MAERTLKVTILGDAKSVQEAFTATESGGGRLEGAFSKLGGQMSTLKGHFRGAIDSLKEVGSVALGVVAGGALSSLGSSVADGFKGAVEQVEEFGKSTIKMMRETGASAEDASALLSVFERFGLDGDAASKSLGVFAKGLAGFTDAAETGLPPGKKFGDILKQMGVEAEDASGKARPMNDVLLDVADRFKEMPDGADKTALAMNLFGKAGKDMLPILNQGKEGIQDLEAEAKKLGLTLSGENVEQIKKFSLAHKDLNEAMAGVKLQIGVALMPLLANLARNAADLAVKFNGAVVPGIRAFGQILQTYVMPILKVWWELLLTILRTVFGPIIQAFRDMSTHAKGAADGLSPLQRTFVMVRDAFITFKQAITGEWTDNSKIEGIHRVVGMLGLAFAYVRDVVITFIQAITGNWTDSSQISGFHRLIGNLGLLIRNDVVPAVVAFVGWIGNLIAAFQSGGLGGGLGKLLGDLGNFGKDLGAKLLELGGKFVEWIAPFIPPMLAKLGELALGLMQWIGAQIPPLVAQLLAWGQQFIDWIGPKIPPMLAKLGELGQRLLSWLGEQIPPLLAQLAAWGQQFLAWVEPKIPPLLAKLGELYVKMEVWLGETLAKIIVQLAKWGAEFIAWVAPQIPPLLAKLAELGGELLVWVGEQIPPLLAKLTEWGAEFVAWVGPQIPPLLAKLAELGGQLLTWIGDQLPVIAEKLTEWGIKFLGWIATDVLPQLPGKLLEIWVAINGFIADVIVKVVPALATMALAFTDWVGKNVLPQLPGALATILTTILGWITGIQGAILTEAARIGEAIVNGMISGVTSVAGNLASAVGSAVSGALGHARSLLGISSPSKAFAEQVGTPIAQGIGAGIRDAAHHISAALGDVLAIPTMTPAALGAGGGGSRMGAGGAAGGPVISIWIDARGNPNAPAIGQAAGAAVANVTGGRAFIAAANSYGRPQ